MRSAGPLADVTNGLTMTSAYIHGLIVREFKATAAEGLYDFLRKKLLGSLKGERRNGYTYLSRTL